MPDLNVSKKSVKQLFSDMQNTNNNFIIPDYQRPYSWDIEKCERLWDDVVEFAQQQQLPTTNTYFLGTIVTYRTRNNDHEVIDGQQRITSLLLLLRAFYKQLENMTPSTNVSGLKQQIEPCIWKLDPISQQPHKTKFHLETKVVLDQQKQVLYQILQNGQVNTQDSDSYSKNFQFFLEQSEDYARRQPLNWEKLVVILLNNCIIFPIECDTQDTALTIFSTLNDRGLPLSDSDIFKAKIYGFKQTQTDKEEFIEAWKELSEICKQAKISVDDIFRYYTHVLRAKNKDTSREIALKKFYENNNYSHLKDSNLISDLIDLAKFWKAINNNETQIDIRDSSVNVNLSLEALQYLHCLKWYTNEFWKYPINVFFITNRKDSQFDDKFKDLLKKLLSFLFVKFLETPTVNAIKTPMYNLGVEIFHERSLSSLKQTLDDNQIQEIQKGFSEVERLTRSLLLLEAYLHPKQTSLIPENFQIEHIFPKQWQDTNYNGWNYNNAMQYLEKLGNKVVIEKQVNILAGNGYFAQKKSRYSNSQIEVVKDLAQYPNNDWLQQDIIDREDKIINKLINFFKANL